MTKPLETRDVERELKIAAPQPPEELLAALKEEIPSDLADRAAPEPRMAPTHRWRLAAAAAFVAMVGVVVVDQVRRQSPSPETFASRDRERAGVPSSEQAVAGPAASDADDSKLAAAEAPGSEAGKETERRGSESSHVASRDRLTTGEDRRDDQPTQNLRQSEAPKSETAIARNEPTPARPNEGLETEGERRQVSTLKERARAATDRLSVGRTESDEQEPQRRVAAVAPAAPPAESREEEVIRVRSATPLLDEKKSANEVAAAPSTGGTAEPNDQPYGDMFFESEGVNPAIDTEDDRYSTFGLDVDTGSYTVTRSYLERGHLPPSDAIRVEEFVNFFSYGDRPPKRGDFALTAEGAPTPFAEGPRYQVVRFGIHGRTIDRADRKPAVLTFVVDVSGSMGRENRLGLVRRSLSLLLDQLYPDDRVGLVVYGSRGEVLLEPTGDHEAIRAAIDRLQPSGSTNAEEGLVLAYELARRFFREDGINRVVLCSDGVANVGATGPASILARIEAAAEEGIELTTIGFGMGNYNDVLMERLADQGDGRYAYVDTIDEARRLFVDDLTGTLETIASDAKVQVEWNPEAVARYRLLGYENRDIADERFRDDTVDAGEIGAGHAVSAVYEIKLTPEAGPRDRLARLSLRHHSPASGEVEEISLDLRVRDLERSWRAASPGLKLAAVVAEFAEVLRGSYWAREADLADLLERARELERELRGEPEVGELVELIDKAKALLP